VSASGSLGAREDARLDTARHPGQAHSGSFIVVNGYVDDKLGAVRGCEASRLSAGTGIPTAPVSYNY
jgi:hypothetical protein